jgi:arginine decarboxylase
MAQNVGSEGPSTSGEGWSPARSAALYQIDGWGEPYFSVNAQGHVEVRPDPRLDRQIDLYELVHDL